MPDPRSPPELPLGVPRPGEVFAGKYRIEGVLGVGGMGAVLAARHLHLDEPVAIKVMLPEIAKAGTTSVRFLREARAAVKIRSEHVARVTDFGVLESGQAYMVMERLVGEDLDSTLRRRGSLPVAEAVDLLLQASEAVAHAHALGIVHRDLKPGNLFVTARRDGTSCLKVLDFGISKAESQGATLDSLHLTKTQEVIGSPMYMAPEQMRSNLPLDTRTDIWSLGVVGYELLTGRLPFDARSMPELTAMVLQDDPPPMNLPHVPAGLERALRRCLEKKPEDRFVHLGAFAAAIAPFGTPDAVHLSLCVAQATGSRPDGEPSGPAPATASASLAPDSLPGGADADGRASRPDVKTAASWSGVGPLAVRRKTSVRLAGVAGVALTALGAIVAWRALAPPVSVHPGATSAAESGAPSSPSPAAASAPGAAPSGADTVAVTATENEASVEAGVATPLAPPRPAAVHRTASPSAPSVVKKSPPAAATPAARAPSIEDQRKN